jgi:pyruvate, orthophosphate dikinase
VAIKGFASPDAVAHVVLSTPETVAPLLDQLAGDGLITTSAGAFKLTDAGTARADELRQAERDAWGAERATAALDGFIDLDQRVKGIVTAWQLRDAEANVINDHTDAAYDADVLERLAVVHGDAIAWLATHEDGCPRLATYRTRLDGALASARGGDGRYVASPRVDSYHGIWFELHEDLIGLAGRTRAGEVEAGRA